MTKNREKEEISKLREKRRKGEITEEMYEIQN